MMHVACVARGNEVAGARLLARRLAALHPEWPLTVVVLPGLRPALVTDEPFTTVPVTDLPLPDLERLLHTAPRGPLAALIRAGLAAHLMDEGAQRVLVLPPDAEVLASLGEFDHLLDRHSAVLVPRVSGSLPDDGHRPDGRDLLEEGEIDDALVATRSRELTDWWIERTLEAAEDAVALARMRGEKPAARLGASPLGAAFTVFKDLVRLEDPGYGVSAWNLHERPLARAADGTLTAADRPVRLMRFTGFRPDRPWWLADSFNRVVVLDDPILSELCGARAEALVREGWLTEAEIGAERSELANGLVYDERLQRLFAEAQDLGEDFGDVFSSAGSEAFETWLREPAPRGGQAGINRYCLDVWKDRPDLQGAYPDLDGPDGEGFVGWLWAHGRPEQKLQPALLPPAPAWLDHVERRVPGVVVTGYLRGNLGLGEAARGYVRALQAAGVSVATRTIATDPPVERLPRGAKQRPDEREFAELSLEEADTQVELLCMNADQLPEHVASAENGAVRRYRIGNWAWETDYIPERWNRAFDLVDEIWVYSTYVAQNIGRASTVPVVTVPLPVEKPDSEGSSLPFELPEGFVFGFAFDFFSTLQRKNPLGAIEAFRRAFQPGEGPVLLLKTINADFRPAERERLRWAIGDRSDILLVDRTLEPLQMAALFQRIDCYVSLHRAEGFGVTLAESMALGKPVIATGFSGNTDFMTPGNSYLVDWSVAPVGPEAEHYPAEGTWAEPSIEHAAAIMREIWSDQEAARRRGARAASDIASMLSPVAVGGIARARLERVVARLHGSTTSGQLPPLLDEVARRVASDLSGGGRSGPRGLARRAVMRAVRPYAIQKRQLDAAVSASLNRLYVELESNRAARERDRARIARLEQRLADLRRGE